MSHRLFSIIVVLGWISSMSWLVTTKILPPILKGQAPTYQNLLPTVASSETIWWEIQMNGQPLGTAKNQIRRDNDGVGSVNTTVELKQFSVDDVLNEIMEHVRVLGFFSRSKEKASFGKINMKIESELSFDAFGELNRFSSNVSIDELEDFIQLQGAVQDSSLRLNVYTNTYAEEPARKLIYDSTVTVPAGTLMTDAFSPQPRLARLRVGQSWTFQRYQPLRPANPVEMMEAKVERRDAIEWEGESVTAHVVAIRRESSGTVTAAREPLGYIWVLKDGTVVRQETKVGNMNVVFNRLPNSSHSAEVERDVQTAESVL
jgi:hypothetical protein